MNNYLSILRFDLIHVSKRGSVWTVSVSRMTSYRKITWSLQVPKLDLCWALPERSEIWHTISRFETFWEFYNTPPCDIETWPFPPPLAAERWGDDILSLLSVIYDTRDINNDVFKFPRAHPVYKYICEPFCVTTSHDYPTSGVNTWELLFASKPLDKTFFGKL